MRQFKHTLSKEVADLTGERKPFRVSVFENAESIMSEVQPDGTDLWDSMERRRERGDDWAFGKYGKECVDLINDGRCEILPPEQVKIRKVHGGKSLKRRKQYNDFDGMVSVEKVLGGSITPFAKKRRVKTKGKTIDVVVSLSINCGYGSDKIAKYAKAVAERVFQLVSQGRNVNVYYCSGGTSCYNNGDGYFTFIKLKSGRNKIDPQRIMTMGYPGMFRYYIFRSQHANGKDISWGRSYQIAKKRKEHSDAILLELIESINKNRKIVYDMGDWDKSKGQLKSITQWDVENCD